MERREFERRLDQPNTEVLLDPLTQYTVWMALWPTEERVDMLNRYDGFFFPVRRSLFKMTLLQCSKLFDGNLRTISLRNLIRAAASNPAELVPYLNPDQVTQWENHIRT